MVDANKFTIEPVSGDPGWSWWTQDQPDRFNTTVIGKVKIRREGDLARVRMMPVTHHLNEMGNIHGGATLGLVDVSLFAGIHLILDMDPTPTVTLDIGTQFIGTGSAQEPLDAIVEVLRETGRLIFMRGTVEQSHGLVAAFSATVRKPSRR